MKPLSAPGRFSAWLARTDWCATLSVKQWLLAHPEIEIVSRDRAGAYADAAAQGAPQAQQIADRWQVCKNLGDAVQAYLVRKKIQMPPSLSPNLTTEQVAAVCTPAPSPAPGPCHYASQEKRERKQALIDQVKTLYEQGHSTREVAALLHLARNTVHKYLPMVGPVQPTPRTRRLSQLDPFYEYLTARWNEGCSNAHQLFEELREKGYRGGETTVRSFVVRLRQGLAGMARPPKRAKQGASASCTSPREVSQLLSKREEDLTSDEKDDLARLLESSGEVKRVYQLVQAFLQMLRERPEIIEHFQSASVALEADLSTLGTQYAHTSGVAGTREALFQTLQMSECVRLSCHGRGHTDKLRFELLVAADNQLPPADASVLASESGHRFLVNWQAITELSRCASIVFSTACASGMAISLRGGERIGLERSLFGAGAVTYVAPLWSVPVAQIQPLINRIMTKYIGNSQKTVAEVVFEEVNMAVAEGVPIWVARSVAVLGDWL